MDLPIGRVTHYYDKIGVAIVAVENQTLQLGDIVKFKGHGNQDFEQKITSMQIEHQKVNRVSSGDIVGIATEQKVKLHSQVYLVG